MRRVAVWVIYVMMAMVGGALLAPLLYWTVQAGSGENPILHALAQHPFHRYVNRAILGLALLGIYPVMRLLGLKKWRDLGLSAPRQHWRILGVGFLIGTASLALVATVVLACRARQPDFDQTIASAAAKVAIAFSSALVVGLLEELMFRGVLFSALRLSFSWKTALVLSSAFYALLHFFAKPANPESVTWETGLEVLRQMLHGFTEPENLFPGSISLFLAGLWLGLAYQKTGSLYFSIGLHAGWIFWMRTYHALTDAEPGAPYAWLWGTAKIMDGWLAALVLGLLLLWFWRFSALSRRCPGGA